LKNRGERGGAENAERKVLLATKRTDFVAVFSPQEGTESRIMKAFISLLGRFVPSDEPVINKHANQMGLV